MWHRTTSIFLIDEQHRFCVNKRPTGWLHLSFGGEVLENEMDNIDLSAKREAEETGLPDLSKIQFKGKEGGLVPKFAFKHKFEDSTSKRWVYTYFIPWHTAISEQIGLHVKPSKSEMDLVTWMTPEEIYKRIKGEFKITADSVEVFKQFMIWCV